MFTGLSLSYAELKINLTTEPWDLASEVAQGTETGDQSDIGIRVGKALLSALWHAASVPMFGSRIGGWALGGIPKGTNFFFRLLHPRSDGS